jgi:hypothetical protein
MTSTDIIRLPSDNYCLNGNAVDCSVWNLHVHKYILWTTVRIQRIKHGGIYPLQHFKRFTNVMAMLNNMTIHGGGNALRTLT